MILKRQEQVAKEMLDVSFKPRMKSQERGSPKVVIKNGQ